MYRTMMDPYERGGGGGPMPAVGGLGGGRAGSGPLTRPNGVGEAGDKAARIFAKSNPQLLTIQESIDQGKKVRGGTILK